MGASKRGLGPGHRPPEHPVRAGSGGSSPAPEAPFGLLAQRAPSRASCRAPVGPDRAPQLPDRQCYPRRTDYRSAGSRHPREPELRDDVRHRAPRWACGYATAGVVRRIKAAFADPGEFVRRTSQAFTAPQADIPATWYQALGAAGRVHGQPCPAILPSDWLRRVFIVCSLRDGDADRSAA